MERLQPVVTDTVQNVYSELWLPHLTITTTTAQLFQC